MNTSKQNNGLEIAIIGMSAEFPESDDYLQFWKNLAQGREMLTFYSREELLALGVSESLLENELFVPCIGGRVKNKDCFDHGFFGYTPDEAALMDPQTRLLHHHCWSALEDAGYPTVADKKKISLFAGASANTNWKIYTHTKGKNSAVDPLYLSMITSPTFITTIVSYKLNLRGPSVFVDSACSTSLTAIHMACRSLLTRECAMALAGGVSICTEVKRGYIYQEGKVSSRDGHCCAFDAAASGTAVGEGAGIVVLKRLNEAIRDNDHIYAVIKATSVNNDGSQKAGYTTPAVRGQADCISAAHKLADVPPRSITYVEAHGTATRLGDPVEVRALNEAFGTGGNEKFCALGSVKTNIGHLDTAAGVAGIIKTTLSLKHQQLPASLHFRTANPEIDFAGGPFYVNTSLKPWERQGGWPLRAGVSSFGIGGTNAHAVLEEAPERAPGSEGKPGSLLCLSARTSQSLVRYLEKLKHFLTEQEINFSDMCYTLHTGRKEFGYRLAAGFSDGSELQSLLASGRLEQAIVRTPENKPAVVLLFPGQGSQYAGMARDLYDAAPLFRAQMDEGFTLLEQTTGISFKELLFNTDKENVQINHTRYAQPLIFLLEYALTVWLKELGVTPQYMIGHSIGEYVAACVSGVFSFHDALTLVAKRGELMAGLPHGCMLSVPITEKDARKYVSSSISLAAVNGPSQVVLSGDPDAVAALKLRLDAEGQVYVQLHTSHAFHSQMMEPVEVAFAAELRKITFGKPTIPILSNLTGHLLQPEEACAVNYWVKHMRETVRFAQGLEKILAQEPNAVFIEAGAGHALVSLLRQQAPAAIALNLVRGVKESINDFRYFSDKLGQLWLHHIPVSWEAYYREERRNRISLPTYSFEPIHYPAEVDPFAGVMQGLLPGGSRSSELKDWLYFPTWKKVRPLPPAPKQEKRTFLFFSYDGFFSGAVKNLLSVNNPATDIIEIFQGDDYKQLSSGCYMLNPADPQHYDRLQEELLVEGRTVTDIVYGWGVGAGDIHFSPRADNHELHMVYFGLVYLIQSLRRHHLVKDRRIAVITDRLYEVTGHEKGNYCQSLLLGLVNVLPQEYSVTCFNIDISLEENISRLATQFTAELLGNTGLGDRIVALRNDHRWIRDYEKNKEEITTHVPSLKPGGIYLVTGGLGNAGYTLSRYLLDHDSSLVILTGRKEPEELLGESRERYTGLHQFNGRAIYRCVDAADDMLLEATVADIENEYGQITGVIHTAGVTAEDHFELVEDMSVPKVLALLKPKVSGIISLYKVFGKRQPDFVWLTSSLASVLGGLGFGAYAAANLFMDHFVLSKSAELPQWHSINLGGMAFAKEEISRLDDTNRYVIKPEELCRLFDWSLSVQGCPVIVQTIEELASRIHQVYEVKKEIYLDENDPASAPLEKTERPGLSTVYVAPETGTEEQMVEIFERFFGIAGIGVTDNFFELGGDSLKAMMLVKRIKNDFSINISLTDFLENTNISALAEKVDQHLWFSNDEKMDNEMVI